MLVVLEGIDGAGKTSLAKGLVTRLEQRGRSCRLQEKKAIPALPPATTRRLALLQRAIWTDEEESDLLGTHFSLYLLAAWYSAFAPRIDARDSLTVVDGWFYRVIVKAHLRARLDLEWLHSLFAHLPQPDRTVLVDIEPRLAFSRRSGFKASELGHWDSRSSGTIAEDFVSYQSQVRSALLDMASEKQWCTVVQDGRTLDALLDELEAVVLGTFESA